MGRLHKPNEVARLTASKTNKAKHEIDIPKHKEPLGNAPFKITPGAARVWDELRDHLLPGVATKSDRYLMEITCELMAEFREDPRRISTSKLAQLTNCLARLGLTPVDRVKLGVKKEGDRGNPFDDF